MVVLVEMSLPTNVKIDELMEKDIVWQKPPVGDRWPDWHSAPSRGSFHEEACQLVQPGAVITFS